MTHAAAVPAPVAPAATGRLLDIDPGELERCYDRAPFTFRHHLSDHPLLQLDRLAELAARLPPPQVHYYRGRTAVGADFDAALKGRQHPLTVEQMLRDMQNADAYVLLHHADTDPAYRALLHRALDEVRPLVERLDPGMCEERAYVFIASPGAVTPYHMDREVNFLCQLRGRKTVQLWSASDREVMTEEEVERFFAHPQLPRPPYRPALAGRARAFALEPGTGVHHPFFAPHAVQNGPEVSVAIALTFRTRAGLRRFAVSRLNDRLRRLGVAPRPFGQRPAVDRLKQLAVRVLDALRPARRR